MSVLTSPYYKRSRLMEKWNLIQNQPLLSNFLQNHLLFRTKKENHGKAHSCWSQNIKRQPQAAQAQYVSYFMWFHIAQYLKWP